jgi:peptide/nickel transport system substrate-binding protein
MVAVPDYWGGGESPGRLVWSAIPAPEARVDALLDGLVDLIADLPRDRVGAIRDRADLAISEQASPTCVAFLCNCFAGPCADRRVRVALNLGLDVPALIEAAAHGDGEPLNGPLTPLHFAHDPGTPRYPHDPEYARRLLAEAGFEDGPDLTADVPLTLPDEAHALARAMAAQWAEIGIRTTIREHADREGYALRVRAKEIGDAACFDSSPLSSYRVLREKLHSGVAGPWWQGYTNAEVDRLIDRAAATPDDAERRAIYRRVYRMIRDDAPWIFLYRPVNRWAAQRGLLEGTWGISATGVIDVGERS